MVLYVTEPGASINKDGGKFVVSKDNIKLTEVPINSMESIVLSSSCNITTKCVNEVINKGISLTYISHSGKYMGKLDSVHFYNVERQMLQFNQYQNEIFSLNLAKKVIKAKIKNSKVILKRHSKDDLVIDSLIAKMDYSRSSIDKVKKLDVLLGVEGNAAKGLHPYVGFMHRIKNGHAALASDLMEEWRAYIVDDLVITLFNSGFFTKEDFDFNKDNKAVYLNKEKSKKFIKEFENKLMRNTSYIKDIDKPISNREAIIYQVNLYTKALNENNDEILCFGLNQLQEDNFVLII